MIISRYVAREIVFVAFVVTVLLALVLVSHRFTLVLEAAAEGQLAAERLVALTFLQLATRLHLLIPLAWFIGVLLALGRLYRDSELIVLFATGYGQPRLLRLVALLSVVAAIGAGAVAFELMPRAVFAYEAALAGARAQAVAANVTPGRFRLFDGGKSVFYARSRAADTDRLEGVFVRIKREDREEVMVARYASKRWVRGGSEEGTGESPASPSAQAGLAGAAASASATAAPVLYLLLEDGARYSGSPGNGDYTVARYRHHAIRLDRIRSPVARDKVEAMPSRELSGKMAAGTDSRTPAQLAAELQRRWSAPVMTLLLGVLAVPLARVRPREGRYGRLFVAILIYVVYLNVVGVAASFLERGEWSAPIGWLSGAAPDWAPDLGPDLALHLGLWPVHALALLGLVTVLAWSGALGTMARTRRRPARPTTRSPDPLPARPGQ